MNKMIDRKDKDGLDELINKSINSLKETIDTLELLSSHKYEHDKDACFIRGGMYGIACLLNSIAIKMKEASDIPREIMDSN